MSFSIDKKEKHTLISISVEKLDSSLSPALKSQLVITNAEGEKNIIINMEQVKYCDSSGLSAILVANRLCKNAGGIFVLANIQEAVRKLISISQLDSILHITETVPEAEELLEHALIERNEN
jgi:anti-sigma B factor antagonist